MNVKSSLATHLRQEYDPPQHQHYNYQGAHCCRVFVTQETKEDTTTSAVLFHRFGQADLSAIFFASRV